MSYDFGRINDLAYKCNQYSIQKGFWENQNSFDITVRLAKLALITEEVGEAVSAVRIADINNLGEELADIIIRVFDFSSMLNINIEQEIVNKMEKNEARAYMHNKLA